jgi:uncharacterized repeat protein (TIGR03803 family)
LICRNAEIPLADDTFRYQALAMGGSDRQAAKLFSYKKYVRRTYQELLALGWLALSVNAAAAQTPSYQVFHRFRFGSVPQGSLLSIGANLYGTTGLGGATGNGTLFVVNRLSFAAEVHPTRPRRVKTR